MSFLFEKKAGKPVPIQRAGGYGALLGDEGSGKHIGQLAITSTLAAYDSNTPFSALHRAVLTHFACLDEPGDLLQRVLETDSLLLPGLGPIDKMASTCRVVFDLAERQLADTGSPSEDVAGVIRTAAGGLVDMVRRLTGQRQVLSSGAVPVTLLLGGSLLNNEIYSDMLQEQLLAQQCKINFTSTRIVKDAGRMAAEILAKQLLL